MEKIYVLRYYKTAFPRKISYYEVMEPKIWAPANTCAVCGAGGEPGFVASTSAGTVLKRRPDLLAGCDVGCARAVSGLRTFSKKSTKEKV